MNSPARTAVANNSPTLLSMPVEVLLQITYHLTTPELGYLRLSCKNLESTLLPSFSREFFTKRQFMIGEFSLQALVDISKSRFATHLTHVIFNCLDQPETYRYERRDGLPAATDDAQYSRRILSSIAHSAFLNADQDTQMLTEAFRKLINLDTIGIRDFNSKSRRRDSPQVVWRSYGARTYELEVGKSMGRRYLGLDSQRLQVSSLGRLFLNVLRSLGKSQSRPKNLEVMVRAGGIYEEALYLPGYVEDAVHPVLANLRAIFLDLSTHPSSYRVNNESVPISCSTHFIKAFLSKLYQLEHLRLNFPRMEMDGTEQLLTWLSQPPIEVSHDITSSALSTEGPPPVKFNRLRQLDIGVSIIEPQTLVALLKNYAATLRTISFHKITLLEAAGTTKEDRVNLWVELFRQLSNLNLNLSSINLSLLRQQQTLDPLIKWRERCITFTDSRGDKRARSWAGSDPQSGLRDFIAFAELSNLDCDTSDEEDSDGDDQDDSDVDLDDD